MTLINAGAQEIEIITKNIISLKMHCIVKLHIAVL